MNFIIKPCLVIGLAMLGLLAPTLAQIKPGKAIQITISGVPPQEKSRFDVLYPVSDQGMINMPFIGKVRAAGLKAEDLAGILQRKYREAEIYTNPTFQVIDSDAKRIDNQIVVVGGYVGGPGAKGFYNGMTLWQAIQAAGGANEFGSMKRVELTRGGEVRVYDCTEDVNRQVKLRPGDTINVPQKNWFGG